MHSKTVTESKRDFSKYLIWLLTPMIMTKEITKESSNQYLGLLTMKMLTFHKFINDLDRKLDRRSTMRFTLML